jgi:hypothetical protein
VPSTVNPRNVPDERVTRADDARRGRNGRNEKRKAMSGMVTWPGYQPV